MHKNWSIFLPSIFLCLCLAACSNSSVPTPSESAESSPSPSIEAPYWTSTSIERNLSADDNTPLLSISYTLPKMENPDLGGIAINTYYEKQLNASLEYAETELYESALSDYQSSDEGFTLYEDSQSYTTVYEDTQYISFLLQYYNFSGGVHPNYALSGDTFRLDTGARVSISTFFNVDAETYRAILLSHITEQAAEQTDFLYENYTAVLSEVFDPEHFYLSEEGFVFYFQPTEIGPFASGLLQYTVPYQNVKDIMNTWN